jgi:hypothetical protein
VDTFDSYHCCCDSQNNKKRHLVFIVVVDHFFLNLSILFLVVASIASSSMRDKIVFNVWNMLNFCDAASHIFLAATGTARILGCNWHCTDLA